MRVIRARSTSTKICEVCQRSQGTEDQDAYLALSDGSQRLDDRQLGVQAGRPIQEAHDDLDHLGNGLFELAMLLGKQKHLLVQLAPFSLVFA